MGTINRPTWQVHKDACEKKLKMNLVWDNDLEDYVLIEKKEKEDPEPEKPPKPLKEPPKEPEPPEEPPKEEVGGEDVGDKDKDEAFECEECGAIVYAKKAPEICPRCGK